MDNLGGGGGDVRSMLESEGKTVFQNKRLLQPETIIGTDRLVGRDEQLKDTVGLFRPILNRDSTANMMFHGPSGTGKSLIVEHVANQTMEIAEETGIDFGVFSLNCNSAKTADDAFYHLAKKVLSQTDSERSIKKQGISTSEKIEVLFDTLGEYFESVVIILDEVDQLYDPGRNNYSYSDVIYQLSRTTELGLEDTDVSVATISNNPTFLENLGSRAYSSYHPTRVHFPDYNSVQLQEILDHRRDAYKKGVVTDGILNLCAALAARDHGDARQAIDLFRNAGKVADEKGESVISEDHVYAAEEIEQRNALHDQISGLSTTKQQALYAVAICIKYVPTKEDKVPGPLVHPLFNHILEIVADRSISKSSYFRYLNELETYAMIKSKDVYMGQSASMKIYSIPEDVGTTLDVLHNNTSLHVLEDEQQSLENKVLNTYKNLDKKPF